MELTFALSELPDVVRKVLEKTGTGKVFAFYGELGAGKTTFIHELCRQMGVDSGLSSPTFSIINEYITENNKVICHMDLYRLKNAMEAVDAGVEECLMSGNTCLVEWPEIISSILPEDTVHCKISLISADQRKLQIKL